jgi:hypothetical protein
MKKQKTNTSVNNSSIEFRPELFDFFANAGKTVTLILKNENVRTGKLLCICPDDAIILEFEPAKLGMIHIGETPLFDVSEIILLDN